MTQIEKAQTVSELTSNEYNELCYNSAGDIIKGEYVSYVCFLLNKSGVRVSITSSYDDTVHAAVLEFQKSHNLPQTGNLNDNTFKHLIYYANEMSDSISDDGDDLSAEDVLSELPHYDTYFGEDKYKIYRKNHKDIKIVFGNESIVKTIKDVFMLSVSVEVDTSGNPISEVYEFIARDVVESDEISDIEKYTIYEHSTSSEVNKINTGPELLSI